MTGGIKPPPADAATRRRRRAQRRGRAAEAWCAWWLRLKGYAVIARNVRFAQGEIDIVARRRNMLVFVEVKSRRDSDNAADALRTDQRQRIAAAAALFLARRPGLADLAVRFDVMLARPWRPPVHLADAWRPE